ncbi:hypothetical protein [Sphingobium sp.]|nr:hypothetical protein [Sphingobium sp.]
MYISTPLEKHASAKVPLTVTGKVDKLAGGTLIQADRPEAGDL